MAFERGFKSLCERRSVEIRTDLSLSKIDPLDAIELAQHMGVKVWSTSDIKGLSPTDTASLTRDDADCWSALTMRIDTHYLVVFKAGQSAPRTNSVIMHELSHIILGHELADACVLGDGSLVARNYDQDQENEADWLGGTLLLPRPALLEIRRKRMSDSDARLKYQVSQQMLAWRFRMTGVDRQIANAWRKMA